MLFRWSTLLTFGCFLGCAGGAVDDGTPASMQEWSIPDEPKVNIGVLDGDERYQFEWLSAAWKQQNGSIVAMDAGRPALIFFDSLGEFQYQVGSRGHGPGEFQASHRAWPYRGDSIVTYDFSLRRLSIWSPDGDYVRSFTNPLVFTRVPGTIPSQSCCNIWGSFSDGSFVGWPPDLIPTHPGADRYATVELSRISPDGELINSLGTFNSALFTYDPTRPNNITDVTPSRQFQYVVIGRRLYGFNSPSTVIESVETSGARDSIPIGGAGEPLTDEMRAAYESAMRQYYSANPTRIEGNLESYLPRKYTDVAPKYVAPTASVSGDIWVLQWEADALWSGRRQRWDVLDLGGVVKASILLPSDSRLAWIGESELLLIEQDAFDVSYLRLYDLHKPQEDDRRSGT